MVEVIQGLWIGPVLGLMERLSIRSFLCHGHEYHLYCYGQPENVPPGTVVKDANAILPACEIFTYPDGPGKGSVAAFANLFRYKLLLEKGGWWADTDVVCLRPHNFVAPVVFASEHAQPGVKLANAVFKLPANHPVARLTFERALADKRTLRWGATGPDLLTRVVGELHMEQFVQPPSVFCPIPWWDWRVVMHPTADAARECIGAETHAIHLWHELWRRERLDRQTEFPPTSLFVELLHRFGIEMPN